jgi:hypothetical protein
LTGLSVRTLFIDLVSQLVIVLYLVELDTSLLVTLPSGAGVLIQVWKCQRATGLAFVRNTSSNTKKRPWWGGLPFTIVATRLVEEKQGAGSSGAVRGKGKDDEKDEDSAATAGAAGEGSVSATSKDKKEVESITEVKSAEELALDRERAWKAAESMRVDALAINHLSLVLLPLVVGFSLRSLLTEQHFSWYAWLLSSLTGTVYTFGFILMTPQLFINHRLKSVSHLPWRFLCFRFVNTFIDDLFAFIIRMPTMHRVACFRDDVVFFVYLYQRWAYPVDELRPMAVEDMGGGE